MSTHDKSADVVVIGAGVAGLAAARALAGRGLGVTLLEQGTAPGGRAWTTAVDGVPVDLGAAFVSDFYTETMRLVEQTGTTASLTRRSQTAYVVRDQVPQAIWPAPGLIEGHALSPLGKLRLLGLLPALLLHWRDLDIGDLPKIAHADRESAADYARHAIGADGTDHFLAPLLRGLLYWDPATTSAAVVWCILKAFAGSKATYRFAGGMGDLVAGLASGLDVRCGARAAGVDRLPDGGFTVRAVADGVPLTLGARAVVCAAPATAAATLADWLPAGMRAFLESLTYSRTTVLTFRVGTSATDYPRGSYLFPSSEVTDLTSINPLYQYVDGVTRPEAGADGALLLNVYLSDQGARDYADLSDADLGGVVLKRLADLLGQPGWVRHAELAHVHHWEQALPRFDVGHIKAVDGFLAERRSASPGLAFAGDYLGGPYIDGAIRSGEAAATAVLAHLGR